MRFGRTQRLRTVARAQTRDPHRGAARHRPLRHTTLLARGAASDGRAPSERALHRGGQRRRARFRRGALRAAHHDRRRACVLAQAQRTAQGTHARAVLEHVDPVFVGGGDVEEGMRVLRDADLIAPLHAAAARGAIFAGMSAGSIMLGQRWIRWPDAQAKDAEAETYECLGLAERSLDTHGSTGRCARLRMSSTTPATPRRSCARCAISDRDEPRAPPRGTIGSGMRGVA